jgi:hypothetical protein
MTLSDLAALGSFVSGIAVLISLVYVAVQIRQTERNQRTLLQQETSSRYVEAIKHWGEPEVAAALLKAQSPGADLTAMEAYVLQNQLRISLTSFQDTFLLQKLSLIDEVQLEGMLRGMRAMFSMPVVRAQWSIAKQMYAPEFACWLDAQIEDVPLAGPIDFAARLKTALAGLKTTNRHLGETS